MFMAFNNRIIFVFIFFSLSDALSYGRTLAKHMQNDPVFLNFERNEIIEITSKSAGDRPDLWGGRVCFNFQNNINL